MEEVGGEGLQRSEFQVRLILNKKKGFVKLALRCGVSLVPTFSFGEAAIYDKVAKIKRQNKSTCFSPSWKARRVRC